MPLDLPCWEDLNLKRWPVYREIQRRNEHFRHRWGDAYDGGVRKRELMKERSWRSWKNFPGRFKPSITRWYPWNVSASCRRLTETRRDSTSFPCYIESKLALWGRAFLFSFSLLPSKWTLPLKWLKAEGSFTTSLLCHLDNLVPLAYFSKNFRSYFLPDNFPFESRDTKHGITTRKLLPVLCSRFKANWAGKLILGFSAHDFDNTSSMEHWNELFDLLHQTQILELIEVVRPLMLKTLGKMFVSSLQHTDLRERLVCDSRIRLHFHSTPAPQLDLDNQSFEDDEFAAVWWSEFAVLRSGR